MESGTTELTRLPGLEVPEVPVPHPSSERGRWIERGPSGKLMLFSGRSNPELSERIALSVPRHKRDAQIQRARQRILDRDAALAQCSKRSNRSAKLNDEQARSELFKTFVVSQQWRQPRGNLQAKGDGQCLLRVRAPRHQRLAMRLGESRKHTHQVL